MSHLLTGDLSPFEALCAAAQDDRPHPEQAELEQFGQAIMTEHLDLLCGTALEDYLPTFAEGLIGAFQSISLRLQREHDRSADDVKRLVRDFAGGEIEDVELQAATAKAHASQAALRAAEFMRDAASDTYTAVTGEIWSPWRGGTKTLASTAALLDAREALRTKRAGDHARTNPGDQVVAFRASPQADTQEDAGRIFDALNWALQQWPSMKLATTGAKGAEKIAIKWARQKSVDVILARVDFNRHGKAAPFRANDELVALEPVCMLTLPTTLNPQRAADVIPFGPALNAGQAAEVKGYRHLPLRLRKAGVIAEPRPVTGRGVFCRHVLPGRLHSTLLQAALRRGAEGRKVQADDTRCASRWRRSQPAPKLYAMCNLYSMTKNRAAVVALVKAMEDNNNNQPPKPAVFPDYAAPVVVQQEGVRLVRDMRWGLPTSKKALLDAATKRADKQRAKGKEVDFDLMLRMEPDGGTTNVRNAVSKHWARWLGPQHRCLVPFTAFSEPDQVGRTLKPVWFALAEGPSARLLRWRARTGVDVRSEDQDG